MLRSLIFTIVIIFSCTLHAQRRSLVNTVEQIKQVIQEHESGQYIDRIEKKLDEAHRYLSYRVSQENNEKLAIVLEIDETALSNFSNLKRLKFTHNVEALTGAYMLGDCHSIQPIQNFYNEAIAHQVAIFFITARPSTPEIISTTTKNLKKQGYGNWEKVYFRPIDNHQLTLQNYKMLARKEIMDEGYTIILNIGSQNIDLKGGYSEATIKLPNPYYVLD